MKLYKIKKSDIIKKEGLYATRDIKAGTDNWLQGKLITKNKLKMINMTIVNQYLFTINKIWLRWRLWNTAGLINHSCDNNCDYDGKGLKIWVKSIRDIKKGEEFTCYGLVSMKITNNFHVNVSQKISGYIVSRV